MLRTSVSFGKIISGDFGAVVEKLKGALKEQGFGVLTTLDFAKIFKEKIDKDVLPSLQLGVCNPNLAYSIYQHDENVALLLPCTVTIQMQKDDKIKIQVADPIQMLTKIDDGSH
eukprot:482294_1